MAAPNIHPITPGAPARASIALATANANRDGTTGAYTTLLTAGANGAVVPSIRAQHAGAAAVLSTAMILRLWHQVAGSGNRFLIDEIALASATPNTAAIGAEAVFNRTNIELGAGDVLAVTQTVAEAVHYSAGLGDF
jgi:hypothetical protein